MDTFIIKTQGVVAEKHDTENRDRAKLLALLPFLNYHQSDERSKVKKL